MGEHHKSNLFKKWWSLSGVCVCLFFINKLVNNNDMGTVGGIKYCIPVASSVVCSELDNGK